MIKRIILVIFVLLLSACSPSAIATSSLSTSTQPAATSTTIMQIDTATPARKIDTARPTIPASPTSIPATETKEPVSFDLSEPGPFFTGNRAYSFIDSNRNNREIKVILWYPAEVQKDNLGRPIKRDAVPDMSGAPYPLILTETASGGTVFLDHLASHGFVMAVINIPDHDEYFSWDINMINWPRDFLFVLDQIALGPEALQGVVDVENTGVTGYSYGGDISLTLSGVRIDPEFFLSYCGQPVVIQTPKYNAEQYHNWTCSLAGKWEEFEKFAGAELTTSDDGLWQPLTDERIRAVMPMAPSGTWLYGERGLAAAEKPMLIVSSTEDEFVPYSDEAVYLFEHLGSPEKYLITFIGRSHMMVWDEPQTSQLKHLVTAYFGKYLQGRDDYAKYFMQDFVSQFDDLAWGIYNE